jgi:hypothetical protein
MLPVILYGCEISTLILWVQHRPRGYGNKVLRRIVGPKREKVMGDWRI